MSDGTLGKIERGELRASPKLQAGLATALGMEVDELFEVPEPHPLDRRDAAIVAAYRASRSAYKVADELGLEVSTVYRALEHEGAERRDRSREKVERLQALATLEANGVPRGELPARLGISKTQLYRYLREEMYPHRGRRPDLTEALTAAHAETRALVQQRIDEGGRLDIDGVAEFLKLTPVGARHWLRQRRVRPVETVPALAGRERVLYDPRAIAAERHVWLREFVDEVWRGDPWRAARWYDNRFGRTVMHGRLAPRLRVKKPNKVTTDEKLERIHKLAAERRPDGRRRHSQQAIANAVGVSRTTVRHHLAKTG
jgi:transcriptional regulator with XRE-family HTH domain/AcrR family transcriptional regulator